jgi:hypothetical protein
MLDKSENLEIGFEIQCYKCEKIGFTSNANDGHMKLLMK